MLKLSTFTVYPNSELKLNLDTASYSTFSEFLIGKFFTEDDYCGREWVQNVKLIYCKSSPVLGEVMNKVLYIIKNFKK